ncbi:hypothetical protein [Bradyrhizobium sp. OK095]|uniref:hypothetical protein n=1 Tax=Bradyrhizobium sp. OK095 TaxID=1882760 RepID=UPI000B87830B|nr:hypothetical protein [Bradyrhizobium sp. OK095]
MRLADIPGIETLTMSIEGGKIMLRWGAGYLAAVSATASDGEIETAIRAMSKLPPLNLIPDRPAPAPVPAAQPSGVSPMSVTGAAAAGQSLREMMEEHRKTLADLTGAHMDKMREGFAKQLQGVNALGKLADKVHAEGDEFLALIGQYTNDLGL